MPADPAPPAQHTSGNLMGAPTVPDTRSSITWNDGAVVTLDQRALPHHRRELTLRSVDEVIEAITSLAVRGAPTIGLIGALGVALSARLHSNAGFLDEDAVRTDARRIVRARPTAVNLSWAVDRTLEQLPNGPGAVLACALELLAEDAATNQAAAERAAHLVTELLPQGQLRILTHCNTGRLATSAVGTALGAILHLAAWGEVREVLVGETRPLLQGARLTAWELGEASVPYRLCTDSAGPAAMARGMVDCVLVGADRIAANGDVANKIGTYALAVAAARHGVPFLVVAPESSWDRTLPDGSGIVVEERDPAEVTGFGGVDIAPAGSAAYNPAFDVTPAELITAIVSERGTVRPCRTTSGGRERDHLGDQLAVMSAALYERGWMPGTAGNLSVRIPGPDDLALITPSGRDKGDLSFTDMVEVTATTGAAARPGSPRPSAETVIHAAVYRHTSARAVIHVHSPYATTVASLQGHGAGILPVLLERYELIKGLGRTEPDGVLVPVFANWPEVPRIADEVAAHLRRETSAVCGLLIVDHGITVWGEDLAQAKNRLECFEAMFQLRLLAGAHPIPAL
ncbi:S-methyl-5-thioribose-1-phosphate isomerase [Streptomyces sp. RKAG293]|uniref:S-methyl-5-thioribose-1-phosphate isomerase n=1 Tax=Streptomyces sp. RKAG293 TaxID=2893403 RepID=UPI002033ECA2|nr:S-methyl-5-thioribose-1-phosphate isomerase [Streptomyces sp. RKAG293]MCM2416754.1 S-methyl-5-thioribose-1-phosphate isomerase [Streptomyces sp. RKAG293]